MRRPLRPSTSLAAASTILLAACGVGGPFATPIPCPAAAPTAAAATDILAEFPAVTIDTTLGSFTVTFNGASAPIAAANFVELARCGFYDGITFHRVLTGFVIQAGDPNTKENQDEFEGLGTGGPGYGFAIELPPEGVTYDPYTVAMANTGRPNSNGSQFFVCLVDLDDRLQRTYSIFGTVTEGRDIVDAIGQVEVRGVTGVPVDPVVINGITPVAAESTPS